MSKVRSLIKSSGRLVTIILLFIVTYSYAMFQGGFVSWFIFYTISPFLFYSLLLTFTPIHIKEVERTISPSKLQRGDTAVVTVRFQNKSWFPFVFLTVKEEGMEDSFKQYLKQQPSQIFLVGFKRNFEWTYEINQLERGVIDFKGLTFTFTDFFGWTVRKKFILNHKRVLIYPKLSTINYKPLQMQFENGGVLAPFAMVKDTSLVTGVREYQPGDKSSWIHWKSFAKNEVLKTKEFEDRQTQELFLTINQSTKKNFEDVVELAASILQTVVKHRGEISFLSAGATRQYFPNVKTQNQLEKVMQHLTVIKSDANIPIEKVLVGEMNLLSSATMIVVTGELTESLKNFFISSTSITRGVVCFVVSSVGDNQSEQTVSLPNVKIIHLSKSEFEQAFTEVVKP